MKKTFCLLTGVLVLALNLHAQTTWYMTPSGTGTRDGMSWNNAFSGTSNQQSVSSNQQMINIITGTMAPGDTLLIGGSQEPWVWRPAVEDTNIQFFLPPVTQCYNDLRFTLTSAASGAEAARKTIRGVDRGHGLPVFFGPQPTRSYATITLTEACSYLTFEDLDIRRRKTAVSVSGTAHQGLQFKGIKAFDVSDHGFYFKHSDNMLVEECSVERYNQRAFRVHYGCDNITFRNCTTDCTQGEHNPSINPDPALRYLDDWITKTSSPIGFDFHEKYSTQPPNTAILIDHCITRNNMGLKPEDYPQGDGFMVQQSNDGVTFLNCISDTARDAGFDLKGINQTINDSAAVNCMKSGVKVWYQGTFNNFIAVNNSTQFIIAASGTFAWSGSITVNNSTLHSGTSAQRGILIEKVNRPSTFNDCIISYAGAAGTYVNGPTGYIPPTFVPSGTTGRFANAGTATNAPRYVNPVIPWDGVGTNYDNQDFGPNKGYNSTVVTPLPVSGRVISLNMVNSSTNALASADVAGVVPVSNWNNSTTSNQVLTNLVDSESDTVSGASAVFYFTNYGYTNNTTTQPPPLDDDTKMMRSHRAGSNTTSMTATVVGLPFTAYDIYVYWGGRTTGQSVPATMTVELQLLTSGTYVTAPDSTRYITDANRAWDGTYNESTATTSGAAVDGNEFVVFRNQTAPEFRIQASGPTRTGISGLQIVEH